VIRAAQSVYFTALGLWVGGLAALGAIVAPTVFRTAPSRVDAGRIFGAVLRTFGIVEVVLAALVLISAWTIRNVPGMQWGKLRTFLVVLLCVLVVMSVFGVDPAVAQASGKIGNVERLADDDPGKIHFKTLHRLSELLAGTTLIAGLALLIISGASFKPPPDGA
jgi:putative copper export protein